MYTIAITSIGGGLGTHLAKMLKKSRHKDLRVLGINQSKKTTAKVFLDAYEQVPSGKNRSYFKKIKKIIRKYKVKLIIPGSDEEALTLSKNIFEIKKNNCQLASVSYETLKIFSNKISTYKYLQLSKIPVPKFITAKNFDELMFKLKEIKDKNFVIKPSISRGGRNVLVVRSDIKKKIEINNGRELHVPFKQFSAKILTQYKGKFPLVIMERLYAPTYDLDMLAHAGKPLRIVPRKRLNSAEPNEGHTIIYNKKLVGIGKKIISIFQLSWLYDCDFMLDKNGKFKVIEINPRISGSAVVSMEAGVPLIDDLISVARSKKIPKIKMPYGKIVYPYVGLVSSTISK